MPQADFEYNERKLEPHEIMTFREQIRKAVAECLGHDDPGGPLIPKDIPVKVTPYGKYDLRNFDVTVTFNAHPYPNRKKALDQKTEAIAKALRPHLPEKYSLVVHGRLMQYAVSSA